jgi:hypothetical protein
MAKKPIVKELLATEEMDFSIDDDALVASSSDVAGKAQVEFQGMLAGVVVKMIGKKIKMASVTAIALAALINGFTTACLTEGKPACALGINWARDNFSVEVLAKRWKEMKGKGANKPSHKVHLATYVSKIRDLHKAELKSASMRIKADYLYEAAAKILRGERDVSVKDIIAVLPQINAGYARGVLGSFSSIAPGDPADLQLAGVEYTAEIIKALEGAVVPILEQMWTELIGSKSE